MASGPLKGIDVGVSGGDSEDGVNDFLDELEVDDLSELSDVQLAEIRTILNEDGGIKGISQEPEEGERTTKTLRAQARQAAGQDREDLFMEQLEQLEGINRDTELLKRIIATLNTTNQVLQTTNQLLADTIDAVMRGQALDIKDTDEVSFDRANKSVQIVQDTDVSTAIVVVKADATNSGALYVGDSDVEVNSGFKVEAGESRTFRVDALSDEFHITAEKEEDKYSYIALGVLEG